MENENGWMQAAIEEARKSEKDVPVGAVVVLNGELLSSGCNRRERDNDPSAHAEIVALRQAAQKLGTWRLNGVVIYCTLEPCPMCAEAMLQSRVARVVFGAFDPVSGAAGSVFDLFANNRIYPKPEVAGGVLEEDCKQLLVEFFKDRRSGKEGRPK